MGFQSLSRDSGRLNYGLSRETVSRIIGVSIPQSGFGAFERANRISAPSRMIMFQSLSRDSGRLNKRRGAEWYGVAKFQSLSRDSGRLNGLLSEVRQPASGGFQSLSRDSGRLNWTLVDLVRLLIRVSIPQSGFGAFEPDHRRQTTDDGPPTTDHGRQTTDDRPPTTDHARLTPYRPGV